MAEFRYGFSVNLAGADFDVVMARTIEALKDEGFGVLTEIDVKSTLKKKLDLDFRRYVILGACNPVLAHQGLSVEPHLGLLLPCNVVVQDGPAGEVVVSIANPQAMFEVVDNPAMGPVAVAVEKKLRRVIAAVAG